MDSVYAANISPTFHTRFAIFILNSGECKFKRYKLLLYANEFIIQCQIYKQIIPYLSFAFCVWIKCAHAFNDLHTFAWIEQHFRCRWFVLPPQLAPACGIQSRTEIFNVSARNLHEASSHRILIKWTGTHATRRDEYAAGIQVRLYSFVVCS